MNTRDDLGEDGFADSGGVKIHYVTKGSGPLVVLIHGIPDFWYSWRNQIPALAQHFQVVAIDQRGFNLSDQPEGVENYTLDKLVGDVEAVVKHFGQQQATLVGHDSGGWISWRYAMAHPDKTERLVIVTLSQRTVAAPGRFESCTPPSRDAARREKFLDLQAKFDEP